MGLLPSLIFLFYSSLVIIISAYCTRHAAATATPPHLCTHQTSLLLFHFQKSFEITEETDSIASCESNGQPSYPKTKSWNISVDCCMWDGVICDELSGEVIGLDLSCSQLQGSINSNSTLFQLSRLQNLNLAFNDFYSSPIDTNFSSFPSLTHLNLSNSGFSGVLPSDFSRMFNLISLDLSSLYGGIVIQPRTFELLLQNLTQVRQLSLQTCTISSRLPRNLSASLELLDLGNTGLFGRLPTQIFHLPNLRLLQLSNNDLTGNSLEVQQNSSSKLSYLDLSNNYLSGELSESIGNLKHLYYLGLSHCNFSGSIHESFGNLTQMTYLNFKLNHITGKLPTTLGNLEKLIFLDLRNNSLEGELPDMFSNFQNTTSLNLSYNLFSGNFPSSIMNMTKLEHLYLSANSLIGPLPTKNVTGFQNLYEFLLSANSINGTLPSWVFSLPSLAYLELDHNQLTGQLCEFQYQSLTTIYLQNNNLNGPIPSSISRLVNLTDLNLSSNNFSGSVDISLFSGMQQLYSLDLSFNNLSLTNNQVNSTLPQSLYILYLSSCGIRDLDFLTGLTDLGELDVSINMLQGQIFSKQRISSYTWAQDLSFLNLSHNYLNDIGPLPSQFLDVLDIRSNFLSGPLLMPSTTIRYYLASNNEFTGEITSSICNLSLLQVLDLSNNNLIGAIPQCLGNMTSDLMVLDLHSNNFEGTVPSSFSPACPLISFNLRDNLLRGGVPSSLSKCTKLELVDIGNNFLTGMFPWWLGNLPELKVLSLRANHMYGPLRISDTELSFPALKILDLSRNEFTDILPPIFFNQLKGMITVNHILEQQFYEADGYYESSVMITTKGMEIVVVHILSIYAVMDLSSNKFQGVIPDVIGNFISIQGLNLSNNKLGGPIPLSFANLTSLESLDLSANEIDGEIPRQLTELTYLQVLNLSENHLTGSIPQGGQFNTFGNTSYIGNDGLCGFPLSRMCGGLQVPTTTTSDSDEKEKKNFISGFTWQAVLIGYGAGLAVGMSTGCLIFLTGKPKAFNKFVEQECSRFRKKKWPKEVKWL